jgi:hypothetical protein
LSRTDQVSRLAGRAPSWASVACPEKAIGSPTFQRSAAAGVSMTGTGGLFGGPTVTRVVTVSEAPAGSVTRRPTVTERLEG